MTGKGLLDYICGSSTIVGLANRNRNDSVYRATVLQWAILVFRDIQNRQQGFHWRFLENSATFNTVASTFSYDILTNINASIDNRNKILTVYDKTNDLTYDYIDYVHFRRLVSDETNDTGDSLLWTKWGDDLMLWPVPDSAITVYVDYIKALTSPVDDSTALDIPATYDPVIIDGVMKYVYMLDPQMGDPKESGARYEAGIARMIADAAMVAAELPRTQSHRNRGDIYRSRLFPLNNIK